MRAFVFLATWYACEVCAVADVPRHALHWTRAPGAESCIAADALAGAVEARLGRRVFTRSEPPAVIIDATVSPRWHVAIVVRDADGAAIGERVLDEPAADCHAVDDALGLVLALIIDPEAASRTPPPPSTPWRFDAGASLLGAAGLLPGIAAGGGVQFGIAPPALPAIEIHAAGWLPDETTGGRFSLFSAGLGVRVPTWVLDSLIGIELARMAGTGIGLDHVQRTSAIIPAVTLEPRLAVALTPRVSFTAGLALWIPLERPRFTFQQAGTEVLVYQPAPLAGIARIGVDLRF